ncbi:uncharacterized protein [Diadema setosum]|uniref:uncharacterized protein n=1 Tax=Diadema setosum TaxID=31175 RepID=UPI003B3AA62F
MGCGGSKSVASEPPQPPQPSSPPDEPQQFETPVEDIRGRDLANDGRAEAVTDKGNGQPSQQAGLKPTEAVPGGSDSQGMQPSSSEVVEETPVEKFTYSEDPEGHTEKKNRENSKENEAEVTKVGDGRNSSLPLGGGVPSQGHPVTGDSRPWSAVSSVDSVAVRGLVADTINRAVAGLTENPGASALVSDSTPTHQSSSQNGEAATTLKDTNHENVAIARVNDIPCKDHPPSGLNRPPSAVSSVDSFAVRVFVADTIKKVATGLEENPDSTPIQTKPAEDPVEVKPPAEDSDIPTDNGVVEEQSNNVLDEDTTPGKQNHSEITKAVESESEANATCASPAEPGKSVDGLLSPSPHETQSKEARPENHEIGKQEGSEVNGEPNDSLQVSDSVTNEPSSGTLDAPGTPADAAVSSCDTPSDAPPLEGAAMVNTSSTDQSAAPLTDETLNNAQLQNDAAPTIHPEVVAGGDALPKSVEVNDAPKPVTDAENRPAEAPPSSQPVVDSSPKCEPNPEAQEQLKRALRSMCLLANPSHILDLACPGINSLQLEQAPAGAKFPFTQLLTKLTTVEELNLANNQMGPQAFRVIMRAMSANTSLKTLSIANNKTDTDSAETVGVMLTSNQTLRSLDLSNNQLGKDFLSRCIGPAMGTNKSLTCLNISSCGATDLKALIEGLQENSTLISLDLSHNQISDSSAFIEGLATILKKSTCAIKELNVRNCGIKDSGLQTLGESLKENTSLIKLHAGGNEVTNLDVFSQMLIRCMQHPSLELLNVNDTRPSTTDAPELAFDAAVEKKESALTALYLANCALTDDIIKALANHLPGCLPHLTEFSLSGNTELTVASLQSLVQMTSTGSASNLTNIHLDQQSLDDLSDQLTKNSALSGLRMLSLCKARMSSTSVGRLGDCVRGPAGLTELCLSGLKLSETEALTQLLSAGDSLSLTNLSLAGCTLNDSDLRPLTSALASNWCVTSLILANNRLTSSGVNELLEAMLKPEVPTIELLNLNSNEISDESQNALAALLAKSPKLHTLSVNRNSLGCETLKAMVQSLQSTSSLRMLDLRNQDRSLDDEDMEELMKNLATKLGFAVEQDEYGAVRLGHGPLAAQSSDLTILLTGLGADIGEVGRALDSAVVKTDYGAKHPRSLGLQHTLHLGAWLSEQDPMSQPELSAASWEAVIGIKKDPSVPSWLKVESMRDCAVYVSNLPGNVSANKLEGDLEGEADCQVKEVCIMKDPVQRKPNGLAWVLMADQESVQKAMDFYHSGQALMFSQPYLISTVSLKLLDLAQGDDTAESISEDMARREKERAAEAAEHKVLLEASFAASKARHEYAKAHPAYADGRIF